MSSSILTARINDGTRLPCASIDAYVGVTPARRRCSEISLTDRVSMRKNFTHSEIEVNRKLHCQYDDRRGVRVHNRNMKFRNRIKEWRKFARLTQSQLAEAAGIAPSYVSELERGNRPYNQELIDKLASVLHCRDIDIIAITPGQTRQAAQEIPIVGKAAADAEGHTIFEDGYASGAHPIIEPFEDGSIATEIQGDSMEPRFRDRERIIWGHMRQDPTPFIGEDVLCRLTDGRVLIKTLARNKTTGNWNLISYNPRHPIIEDVKLEWVRPFEGLRH